MINLLIKWVGIFLTSFVFGWYVYCFKKIIIKEKEIIRLKNQIDNIEKDDKSISILRSGYVNQSQFEKMTEKRKKPMVDQLETLKLERQFILDKMPLVSIFKK